MVDSHVYSTQGSYCRWSWAGGGVTHCTVHGWRFVRYRGGRSRGRCLGDWRGERHRSPVQRPSEPRGPHATACPRHPRATRPPDVIPAVAETSRNFMQFILFKPRKNQVEKLLKNSALSEKNTQVAYFTYL